MASTASDVRYFDVQQAEATAVIDRVAGGCGLMATAINECGKVLPPPTFDAKGGPRPRWDFEPKDRRLAVLLIAAKAVSSMHAVTILWRFVHLQEAWALMRIVDDCCDDVFLLTTPTGVSASSTLQDAKLLEFFHTSPIDRAAPSAEPAKPKTVRRDKIAAELGNYLHDATGTDNRHSIIESFKKLQNVHSGYVHANFWRIVEMISGQSEEAFHVHMLGTPDPVQAGELATYIVSKARSVALAVRKAATFLGSEEGMRRAELSDAALTVADELDSKRSPIAAES